MEGLKRNAQHAASAAKWRVPTLSPLIRWQRQPHHARSTFQSKTRVPINEGEPILGHVTRFVPLGPSIIVTVKRELQHRLQEGRAVRGHVPKALRHVAVGELVGTINHLKVHVTIRSRQKAALRGDNEAAAARDRAQHCPDVENRLRERRTIVLPVEGHDLDEFLQLLGHDMWSERDDRKRYLLVQRMEH